MPNILVSSRNIWLYVADAGAVADIWRGGKDFPREVSVTESVIVWSEAVTVAHNVLRYWTSKPSVDTAADDLRTLSLHVMSRAGFGKSFKFQGHEEREAAAPADISMSYKDSLQIILENCILVYEEEKQAHVKGKSADRNFMTSLVRASQDETDSSLAGLTESEIYGNMFTFNFAGHNTTAHTFTFALNFLAANPNIQDWVSEEICHALGGREPHGWSLSSDFPRLRRCLAVMYETLRLYTPVPTSKFCRWAAASTDPQYWGDDSLEWRPSRFIRSPDPTSITTGTPLDNEEFSTPERGTYLAWSGGARDCVGRKFSQVEFVAVMASLFRDWRVGPVLRDNETPEGARKRVLEQIETDSAPVLLLQMLHPERCPLVWSRK
ncbi:hypothetical protein SLS53_008272 [Cytospora paraplurivora]|uniref:Cytochrome P450 n=1 Tax=Cytospora paraplurivora TaxID=2898453 RepID=A0AAN9YC96_9PEZI